MKSFTKTVLIAAMIAIPVASIAQSGQQATRAQVRAELAQLEKAGYDPADRIHFPQNIQAAEGKMAAQNGVAQATMAGYGGSVDGTARSGAAIGQ